ncbi:MAG TPA: hypothetical protein VFD72_02285, partial [Sphingobacteriaceae bacterium]|nr:hypothetical protein [Sphingobacteriaceae bacterium]
PSLQDEIHISYIHEFERIEKPNFLQILTRILAIHYEIAAEQDETLLRNREQEIRLIAEPLGYRLLTHYFSAIFKAKKNR